MSKTFNTLVLRLLFATPLGLALLPTTALAQSNDLQGIDGDLGDAMGQDRMADLGIITELVATGIRMMEDFIGPAMGVALLLGSINVGARHGDMMGALRYAIGGLFCFGLPYLIDLALNFGA